MKMNIRKMALLLLLVLLCPLLAACAGSAEGGEVKVDIDLTKLSDTMRYSYAYNLMYTEPEKNLGKMVKISGTYMTSYYEPTNQYYNYVVLGDVTGCCSLGVEFTFDEELGELPATETQIEVVGAFSSYEELGYTYYCLKAVSLRTL